MSRIILHCDMNNFYASVECVMHPELKGRPIAVCGDSEDRHGIVLAKNYIAKEYGIRTAETVCSAVKKCPELVMIPPHFEEYMKYSRLAREIYGRYTPLVEPFGLDECWLDLTGRCKGEQDGVRIGNEIKSIIRRELGLTVSVGVSFNKVFAKLGSDLKKPDAVTLIPKNGFLSIIGGLPVSELIGVGGSTGEMLGRYGIFTVKQLSSFSKGMLERMLGKCGEELWYNANGLDISPVTQRDPETVDKSVGNGITAPTDIESRDDVWRVMLGLADEVGHRLSENGKRAASVSIQIKDNELAVKQWQCPLECPTQSPYMIAKQAFRLFCDSYSWRRPIRAVSVRAINLVSDAEPSQVSFFKNTAHVINEQSERLGRTVEGIRGRFGDEIIRNAITLDKSKLPRHKIPNTLPGGVRK